MRVNAYTSNIYRQMVNVYQENRKTRDTPHLYFEKASKKISKVLKEPRIKEGMLSEYNEILKSIPYTNMENFAVKLYSELKDIDFGSLFKFYKIIHDGGSELYGLVYSLKKERGKGNKRLIAVVENKNKRYEFKGFVLAEHTNSSQEVKICNGKLTLKGYRIIEKVLVEDLL